MTNIKPITQPQKLVVNALGSFTKSINKVEKANTLLTKEVGALDAEAERITAEIYLKKNRLEEIRVSKLDALAEMESNKDLVARLQTFTK